MLFYNYIYSHYKNSSKDEYFTTMYKVDNETVHNYK